MFEVNWILTEYYTQSQGVVTSVPRVHSDATGIKMKSTDQGQFLGQSSDQDGPQSTIKRRSWTEVSSPDYAFTHRWGRGRSKTGVVIVDTPPICARAVSRQPHPLTSVAKGVAFGAR